MCACQFVTSISCARNSGLSGQTSGGTGHPRRHPALVGARLVRQEVGAENCRDRRETRRTRFSRRKAVSRRSDILPRFPAVSLHASATAVTSLLTMRDFGLLQLQGSRCGGAGARFHFPTITTKHPTKYKAISTARPETTTRADETTKYGSNLSNR